jgi:hypothetical protein
MAWRGHCGWMCRWVAGPAMCALMLGGGLAGLVGQELKPVEDAGVPTLHAYTDLVQIPALVLDYDRDPVAAIAPGRFYVSLDGGPRFRVTHARLEGDDAISLAIVMDLSEPFPNLEEKMDSAVAGLAPGFLHSIDRVSIYAMDCQLERTAHAAPVDDQTMRRATALALEGWRAHGRMRWTRSCTKPSNLWDSLALVTQDLAKQTGRRAILVVTDGADRGSKAQWNALRLYAQASGVAIFGLTGLGSGRLSSSYAGTEYEFQSVCELSGGEVLTTDAKGLAKELQRFTTLLRDRYIVEFPHATDTKGGYHDMRITIKDSTADIYTAGATIPVDDAAALRDPTRIQSDPANAPQLGKRKVIAPD